MFGYDSAQDYFDYQDQVARENEERARRENELEGYHAECEMADEEERLNEENELYNAMAHQYEEDLMHYEDNIDF
jgi:type II secretory pathway component HofQ